MPYAPGASETVSVELPSCAGKTPGSSASTEHALVRDMLWGWQSPTPCREKRSSAQGRVYSFPSWPEAPTGWGGWAPCSCVRITVLETGPIWASYRGSWERGHLLPLMEQGLPPWSWWRHEATGTARWGGTCTDMLALRKQSRETVCVEMHLCINILNGSLWRARFRMRRSKIGLTHHLSRVRLSKCCRTLTSSLLEAPALSRLSPAGPGFQHAELGRTPGELNHVAESDGSQEPAKQSREC